MGQTRNSWYYRHLKDHHAENNMPGIVSSKIRLWRDELPDFFCNVSRFEFFIWIGMPPYSTSKPKFVLALKFELWEQASHLLIYVLATYDLRSTVFVMRIR